MKFRQLIVLLTVCTIGMISCKRNDPKPTPNPPSGDRANLTRDSIFLYAKQVYLWNDALPTYDAFNPRKYTTGTDYASYQEELFAISQLKLNPATALPYEYYSNGTQSKFSYIGDLANKNPSAFVPEKQSAVDDEGNGNDFGLRLSAYGQGGTTFALFVTAVYQNSPADKAGMVRSDRIYKVNGRAIGDNSGADLDFVNAAFNGTAPIALEGVKYKNGIADAAYTVTLAKTVYKSSPIYGKKVFTAGDKKIGYLAYARFSTLSTNSKPDLDLAFSEFNAAGVTDLIIDLRYNGGGFVNTAQYLINQIAPASTNGKIMFSEHSNALMQANGASILANQPLVDGNRKIIYQNGRMLTYFDLDYSVAGNTEVFSKSSSFNSDNKVTRVVFIVSGRTASASELTINALRPYMEVKLVGTKTYGKPVGFFPITLENKYEVYMPSFQTKNSLGQGDFFDGFTPDVVDDFDDPRNNFGDPLEYYTLLAINQLAPNVIVTAAPKTMSIQGRNVSVESLRPMNSVVGGNQFMGMIETRHSLKK